MKRKLFICCISFYLILIGQYVYAQRTLIFINQTNKNVWVGAQGNPLPANGGFALPAGTQKTITVPNGSSAIRFWGRTGCNFDANGNGTCETGDCARGLVCNGAGGIPPATLAEFTFDAPVDFYDISLVDGYNLPMRIIPVPGTYTLPAGADKYSCGIAGCTSDLNLTCPAELQVKNSSNQVVACMSACMKFNTSQYCCTGPNGTPATCPPTNYSKTFKVACPDAYSYAYDDQTSTYTCSKATYQIIFGTGGGSTPSGVATFYKDCNYGGYAVGLNTGDYTLSQLTAKGILNDDVSSITVNNGYEVQLFENDNFTGASLVVNANNSCLVNNSWNDKASSLKVRTSSTRTIEAESYNAMAGVQTESTTDAGGGLNVGWIDAGDWMAYNSINFPTTGSYKIEYRVASISGGKLSSDLNAGSIQLGAINVPATGGWQTWTTISQTVTVNAGTYNFGIFAQTGGWNINWFKITNLSAARLSLLDDNSIDSESELELYPNPTDNTLHLKSSLNLNGAEVKVFDAKGIEMLSTSVDADAIDVSMLKTGIYTLMISNNGNKMNRKFMKQ